MTSTSQHKVVCYGEVLWDILPGKTLPGGAPMNVAYHLQKLGINPALITKVGLDSHGEKLVSILSDCGVTTEYFQIDNEQPTGLVYAKPNEHNEVAYDIVYPSAWDFIQWDEELSTLVQEADYLVFGSLTSRNKESRDTLYKLIEAAKTKVLDINLRPPNFNRPHVEYLLSKADILKMNEAELELITGWFNQYTTNEERIQQLQDKFNVDTIIVTLGGDGALIKHKDAISRHAGIKVTVADTIGSGDAFLAGFIYKLSEGATPSQALSFASGLGAFIASKSGACPQYDLSEVDALLKNNEQNTISNF